MFNVNICELRWRFQLSASRKISVNWREKKKKKNHTTSKLFYSGTLLRAIWPNTVSQLWRSVPNREGRSYDEFLLGPCGGWGGGEIIEHPNMTVNHQNRHLKLTLVLSYIWEDGRIWGHKYLRVCFPVFPKHSVLSYSLSQIPLRVYCMSMLLFSH